MIDLYETLGVKRRASTAQIERAYWRIKNRRRPAAANEEALVLYLVTQLEISVALPVLTDPVRRARYDSLLENEELARSVAEDFTVRVPDPATGEKERKVIMGDGQFRAVKALLKLRELKVRHRCACGPMKTSDLVVHLSN